MYTDSGNLMIIFKINSNFNYIFLGGEFKNALFNKEIDKKLNINHYYPSPRNRIKAAMAERAIDKLLYSKMFPEIILIFFFSFRNNQTETI